MQTMQVDQVRQQVSFLTRMVLSTRRDRRNLQGSGAQSESGEKIGQLVSFYNKKFLHLSLYIQYIDRLLSICLVQIAVKIEFFVFVFLILSLNWIQTHKYNA